MMRCPVWVTGIGAICACGANVPAISNALLQGARPQCIPQCFPPDAGHNPVCPVQDAWVTPSAQSGNLPSWRTGSTADTQRLLFTALEEALSSAGLTPEHATGAGVCIGTTAGCALHFLADYDIVRRHAQPEPGTCPAIDAFYHNSPALDVLRTFPGEKTSTPCLTISNACTSGADAIGIAGQWIASGRCDVALAGGADALSVVPYIGFNKLMIYADTPCRPFDSNRTGLNLGEGGAVVVLESPEHATSRGVTPLALLSGYGACSDAYHLTAPHPQGNGLRRAIRAALDNAGRGVGDLAFINAHGTATRDNDTVEGLVYSQECGSVPIWASKGSTGHCLGGAGALEAVLTINALQMGCIPPSTGCITPEERIASSIVLTPTRIDKHHALSASLGFGGSNATLVFSLPETSGV